MILKKQKLKILVLNDNYIEVKNNHKIIYSLSINRNYFKFKLFLRLLERNKIEDIIKILESELK